MTFIGHVKYKVFFINTAALNIDIRWQKHAELPKRLPFKIPNV